MKTDFQSTLLYNMKRLLAVILVAVIALSMFSCKKEEKENSGETADSKQYQSYDDLEFKSNSRFADEEILGFKHKEGSYVAELGSISCIAAGKVGFTAPFDASSITEFSDMSAYCGATVGQNVKEMCDSFGLDKGYAAYATKDGSLEMYEDSKDVAVDKEKGGCIYFGYALDGTGKWGFMDFDMLRSVILNMLVIDGAQGDYNVVLYICSIDGEKNITQISQMYGELNSVMSIISAMAQNGE